MAEEKKKKRVRRYYDYSLVAIVVFLTVFGLVMIYSSSSYSAQIAYGDPAYFLKRQALYALFGFVLMIACSHIDYHLYLKFALLGYAVSAVLMILVRVIGKEINGQKRWIAIGPVTFQPSEIAKIGLIVFLAVYIVSLKDEIDKYSGLFKVAGLTLPLAVLVAINSLSAGIIIVMIGVIMAFVSTRKKLVFGAAAGFILLVLTFVQPIADFCYNIGVLRPYQYSRIMVWLEPEAHPLDGGYQVLQGLYAIGSGGLTGKGLGESIQKLGFVPEAQNDMIFAIICEELGLVGAVSVIFVFFFMFYRFLIIANSAPDIYGSLLVTGIMAHIAIQLILNIAVVCNVIPNTGITLPFISCGGTSLILLMFEISMVLSVSRSIRMEY